MVINWRERIHNIPNHEEIVANIVSRIYEDSPFRVELDYLGNCCKVFYRDEELTNVQEVVINCEADKPTTITLKLVKKG